MEDTSDDTNAFIAITLEANETKRKVLLAQYCCKTKRRIITALKKEFEKTCKLNEERKREIKNIEDSKMASETHMASMRAAIKYAMERNVDQNKGLLTLKQNKEKMLKHFKELENRNNEKWKLYQKVYESAPLSKQRAALQNEVRLQTFYIHELQHVILNIKESLNMWNGIRDKRDQNIIIEFANFMVQRPIKIKMLQDTKQEVNRLNKEIINLTTKKVFVNEKGKDVTFGLQSRKELRQNSGKPSSGTVGTKVEFGLPSLTQYFDRFLHQTQLQIPQIADATKETRSNNVQQYNLHEQGTLSHDDTPVTLKIFKNTFDRYSYAAESNQPINPPQDMMYNLNTLNKQPTNLDSEKQIQVIEDVQVDKEKTSSIIRSIDQTVLQPVELIGLQRSHIDGHEDTGIKELVETYNNKRVCSQDNEQSPSLKLHNHQDDKIKNNSTCKEVNIQSQGHNSQGNANAASKIRQRYRERNSPYQNGQRSSEGMSLSQSNKNSGESIETSQKNQQRGKEMKLSQEKPKSRGQHVDHETVIKSNLLYSINGKQEVKNIKNPTPVDKSFGDLSIESQGNVSYTSQVSTDSYDAMKEKILKKYNFDSSPTFEYSKQNLMSKIEEKVNVTSKFFSKNHSSNNEANIEEVKVNKDCQNTFERGRVEPGTSTNNEETSTTQERDVMNNSQEMNTQGLLEHETLCSEASSGETDLDVSGADFSKYLETSATILLSPKADIPKAFTDDNESEQGGGGFMSGLRKSRLGFFGGSSAQVQPGDESAFNKEEDFNFNFGGTDTKKKKTGFFSMFG